MLLGTCGNDLWTRVSWLRGLVAFLDCNYLRTQDELRAWAPAANYKRDFEAACPNSGWPPTSGW